MVLPMLADLYLGNQDWMVFCMCIVFMAFVGGALIFSNRGPKFSINRREAFFLTTSSWLVICAFGALPFYLCELQMPRVDAVFESVSGLTTTGATVIISLDETPPGILIWRALLQWLGGIGIIVMALSIMPFLNVGGMQLFKTESSEDEKAMPRAAQLSNAIVMIYIALTFLCAVCYKFGGMGLFDSVAHAMTTISTGGFSTSDLSFAKYNAIGIEITAIVFMILSALPFVLFLKAMQGNYKPLLRDTQVQGFLGILGAAVLLLAGYLYLQGAPIWDSLLNAAFHGVSVMTGTGYATSNYAAWGSFAVAILLFLMTIGGCAGSTTCGLKVFRFEILFAITTTQIKKLIHPSGAFQARYNGRVLPRDISMSVMSFFFMFACTFALAALALSFTGLDFMTSLSGVAATLSNVGPGLGPVIAPGSTYQPLPETAKWILCLCMIMGRLELFTVIVMFSPYFWRR